MAPPKGYRPSNLSAAGKGRKKGVPNKVSRDLKEMVIEALHRAGGVDYLVTQAEKNPQAFLSLLGKVLPRYPMVLNGTEAGGDTRAVTVMFDRPTIEGVAETDEHNGVTP